MLVLLTGELRMSDPSTVDVVRRAQVALSASPIYDLRELLVEKVGDAIELSGDVDSWHHKQLAQEVVRVVAGNKSVINVVEVRNHPAFAENEASIF